MPVLVKIAWRNLWRNPRRSWVLITAVALGVFCFLGTTSLMDGMTLQMVNTTIETQGGHIQIAATGYHQNPTIQKYIADPSRVDTVLSTIPGIHSAPHVTFSGMATSAGQSAGVQVNGVDPARQPQITTIAASITKGRYLHPDTAGTIVIGEALAKRLDARVGERLVIMSNDLSTDVSAAAYDIVGFYSVSSSGFEQQNVYVHLSDAQQLVGYTDQVTAFSVRLDSGTDLQPTLRRISERIGTGTLEILSWRDRYPVLVTTLEAYDYSVLLLVVILFTAVAFTLINSFLMVIFERIRELGIMMANGTQPRHIRIMLYLEAVFIFLIGAALGTVVSMGVIGYLSARGLDLSAFAAGLQTAGIGTVIYPYIDWTHVGLGFVVIVAMVLLAVLYPAFKASRFNPVDAINYA